MQPYGIYCIEREWEQSAWTASPPLKALAAHHGVGYCAKTGISTGDAFLEALSQWTTLCESFGILYISSHGFPGGITVGCDPVRDTVRLGQMADLLESAQVDNGGCLLHFGTCSTQKLVRQGFSDFRERTGFEAISGYRRDVDWIKSMAFDLLYLDLVIATAIRSSDRKKHQPLDADFMETVVGELEERSWYGLGMSLGFGIENGV
ncbi:MAG: hypothetical protein OXG82_16925 [Gammaproteobacteria bacterium]|nr:hypothetical protein [Gammaproteobacteria bacterium]